MSENTRKLDFSILDSMDIPEIKGGAEVATAEEETPVETKEVITEVDSINDLEEENETVEIEEENEDLGTPNPEVQDEEDPILSIAKWGHEIGIFDLDEEKFKNAEDKEEFFKAQFDEKVKAAAMESLPPVLRDIAEKYFEGAPLDELITSQSNMQRLENLTDEQLEDENIQENLVRAHLEINGYEKEEIDEKIGKFKDALLLEGEAKTALKKLKVYEKKQEEEVQAQAKKRDIDNQKRYDDYITDLKKDFNDRKTFIENVEISKESKDKLLAGILRKDREGKTELERKMQDRNVQLAVAQFVLIHDAKIDSIKRTATTEAATKAKQKANSEEPVRRTPTKLDVATAKKAMQTIRRKNF